MSLQLLKLQFRFHNRKQVSLPSWPDMLTLHGNRCRWSNIIEETCKVFQSVLTFVFLGSSEGPDSFLKSVSHKDDGEIYRENMFMLVKSYTKQHICGKLLFNWFSRKWRIKREECGTGIGKRKVVAGRCKKNGWAKWWMLRWKFCTATAKVYTEEWNEQHSVNLLT